jgi:5,5'-dehydrodivanillate O-demethylase
MAATIERPPAKQWTEADWEDYVQTGPDTLCGQYLRRFWHPVFIAEDLPAGRAKPIRILSEDLTLYRGEGGAPHVVAFRCAHRGTQLSTGWVEGDEIRCFYHGWKYDGSGQCVEQPAEPEPFCQRIRIRGYPTQEYLGLIWTYLGEGDPPPLPRWRQIENEDDGELTVRGGNVVPTSYVNNLENDPVHVPFVHREAGAAQEIPIVEPMETEYGTRDRQPNIEILNQLTHRIMPYGRLLRAFTAFPPEYGWAEQMIWFVPVDDDHHVGFNVMKMHMTPAGVEKFNEERPWRRGNPTAWTHHQMVETAAKALAGELDIHAVDRKTPNLVPLQDLVSQWGQGSIRNRWDERLGRSDAGVRLWRSVYQRELRAFAEGQPLKDWTLPEQFELPRKA